MRGNRLTTACGLALAVALGIPAAAQATVIGPGPTGARTTAAAPDATLSCAVMYDVGDSRYGGWDDYQEIYFGYALRVIHASRQKCRPITAEMVVANVASGRR
jgi:hypothetical protein